METARGRGPSVRTGILVALLLNLLLALAGLGSALPGTMSEHEQHAVHRALQMGASGDLDPGPLALYGRGIIWYALLAVFGGYYGAGRLLGWFPDAASFGASFFIDPTPFLLLGRFTGAAISTATVAVAAAAVARRFGGRAAVWAALLLAVAPEHVGRSHYPDADALSALLVAAVLWTWATGRPPILGALLGGLAVGAKWPAAPVLVLPLLDALDRRSRRALVAVPLAAAAGFVAANPFYVLRARRYWALALETTGEFAGTGAGGAVFGRRGLYHLPYLGPYAAEALTTGGALLVVLGAVLAARRLGRAALVPAAGGAAYVLLAGVSSYPLGYRDVVLPLLVPYAGIAAAEAFGVASAPRLRAALLSVLVAAFVEAGARNARTIEALAVPGDVPRIVGWIESNVPAGARIVFLDDSLLYRLRNTADRAEALARRAEETGDQRLAYFRAEAAWMRAHPDRPGYVLVPVLGPVGDEEQHTADQRGVARTWEGILLAEADPDSILAGADVLVVTLTGDPSPARAALRAAAERRGRLIWRFDGAQRSGSTTEVWDLRPAAAVAPAAGPPL